MLLHILHIIFITIWRMCNLFFIMVALWSRADHYIFARSFVLSFFPLPNLSHHRLDVCHTSTHGVALVLI